MRIHHLRRLIHLAWLAALAVACSIAQPPSVTSGPHSFAPPPAAPEMVSPSEAPPAPDAVLPASVDEPDPRIELSEASGRGVEPLRAVDVPLPSEAPRWLKNHRETWLWPSPEATDGSFTRLPQWSWLELLGPAQNGRLLVRYSGDGRYRLPGHAWVDARDVGPVHPPDPQDTPRADPATTRPDVLRLSVPYRSQLDGSPWEGANCGPATLGMGLEALGINVSSTQLRREVQNAQQLWGNYVGSYIWALARVAERHGAQVLDLYERDGTLKRWSLDDLRGHLRQGRPVTLQVRYPALPGRADADYRGDHYIILTGLAGDAFLYNDSIDKDGVGFDRLMTADELQRAMNASDRKYAYAGFALARR